LGAVFGSRDAPDFGHRRAGLDLFNDLLFALTGGFEIRVDLFAAVEIKRRDSVNVRKRGGWVLLIDLFGSGALLERVDQTEQCHAGAPDSVDTPRITLKGRWNWSNVKACHDRPSVPTGSGVHAAERR
jgi:hypothetical protein